MTSDPLRLTLIYITTLNRKLTGKRQRFVAQFVLDGDGANAARRAGYSAKSAKVIACRLLKLPEIQSAIANQRDAIVNQPIVERHGTIADATERRERLSAIFRDETAHPIARLKAADILNKMDGEYIERHEITMVPVFALPPGVRPNVTKELPA